MTQDALFAGAAAAPVSGALVVAATDGSARPNPGRAAGAWFVDERCWQAVAVEGTSTNAVGELVAVQALLEAVPADRPLHVVHDSTYAQKCVSEADVSVIALVGEPHGPHDAEHALNRAADARAGAVVAALHAGTAPVTGPGWTA